MTWLYCAVGIFAGFSVVTVYLLFRLRGQYNDLRDRNNQACRDNAGLRDKLARAVGDLAIEQARSAGLEAAVIVLREMRDRNAASITRLCELLNEEDQVEGKGA